MRGVGCDSPLKRRNPGRAAGASSQIQETRTGINQQAPCYSAWQAPLYGRGVRYRSLTPQQDRRPHDQAR
jgi:hypothetical protein